MWAKRLFGVGKPTLGKTTFWCVRADMWARWHCNFKWMYLSYSAVYINQLGELHFLAEFGINVGSTWPWGIPVLWQWESQQNWDTILHTQRSYLYSLSVCVISLPISLAILLGFKKGQQRKIKTDVSSKFPLWAEFFIPNGKFEKYVLINTGMQKEKFREASWVSDQAFRET